MKEEDVLQKLLNGLEQLVGLTEKRLEAGPMKGEVEPGVEELLTDLEMKVDLLQKAKNQAEKETQSLNSTNEEVTKKNERLINRTDRLAAKSKAIKEVIDDVATGKGANKKKTLKKTGHKKSEKSRREKFKPLGGTKGWMPL